MGLIKAALGALWRTSGKSTLTYTLYFVFNMIY